MLIKKHKQKEKRAPVWINYALVGALLGSGSMFAMTKLGLNIDVIRETKQESLYERIAVDLDSDAIIGEQSWLTSMRIFSYENHERVQGVESRTVPLSESERNLWLGLIAYVGGFTALLSQMLYLFNRQNTEENHPSRIRNNKEL